ncbi:hypothetical protein QBC45DRAFT_311924, partial [Copromyces sp. CBS 386.78]
RCAVPEKKVAATDVIVTRKAGETGNTGKTSQGMALAVATRRQPSRQLATYMS